MTGSDAPDPPRRARLGRSRVTYREARSILTRASGFVGEYDFTLNPYSGCTFGCSYCYAAFFARSGEPRDAWGEWVEVKENAIALLARRRPGALDGKRIYMSSVTDPYQPVERELELTRGLLEILVTRHRPRLVVQTRAPLVTRDADLLSQLDHVRVNMTVTTDDDEVRRLFEPGCPSNRARLRAVRALTDAGIECAVTLTPLLPVRDPDALAASVLASGATRVVVQDFHVTRGSFVAGTRDAALTLLAARGWDDAAYRRTLVTLRDAIPTLLEGREGFAPV